MAMKLHFEPNLEYQLAAIEAVCDIFRGQEACCTEFTVALPHEANQVRLSSTEAALGIGNRLRLLEDEILSNLQAVQLRSALAPTLSIFSGDYNFTVEMETGTGKTYVYLRTIFELNKRFGFSKFVIVVPSVAIKEGVYKSLQITEEHFKALYSGTPYSYFLYDSSKLGQVRDFATSSDIRIMVVTVGAINKKDVNNLYKESEKTGGDKPIDLIRNTQPIIIVDEPQSVDGGLEGRGKEALGAMNPLCTLRYSATHVDKHHMAYRLDAVDAYQQKLVKQIDVASLQVEGGYNKAYIRVVDAFNKRGQVRAKLEVDVMHGDHVNRKEITVQAGDNLEFLAGRSMYENCLVGEIRCAPGNESVDFSHLPSPLRKGETVGDVDEDTVKRHMIARTIKEHLDKELRLAPLGIKVLSLFFIDKVEYYRYYDSGSPVKGKYALIFEEEYIKAMALPRYKTLLQYQPHIDFQTLATEVHNGYFSIDKKGAWQETAENNQANRDNAERAYSLIMKEKEKLLSFDSRLKFIFSHSALREGWDNPNVFQICTLRDMGTKRERRQTIGRGLRLCVNQQGERQRGFDVNTLTVVATESYEQFAENLQKEIETDTGIRFGIVEEHQFAGISTLDQNGNAVPLGIEASANIWAYLRTSEYIDSKGKVQDSLRIALKNDTLELPVEFSISAGAIKATLRKLAGRLDIKNADERKTIPTRQAVLHSAEFAALWERIKHRTTYRLAFDNDKLIEDCIASLREAPVVNRVRVRITKADINIDKGGVASTQTSIAPTVALEEQDIVLPDILGYLQNKTQLTRLSLANILVKSGRLDDFKRNPQQFAELATEVISRRKRMVLTDGIRYQRIGDEVYYAQELFEQEELTGYLKNMLAVQKSVHEYVVYDSAVEQTFAHDLELNEAVKIYAKLPGWFTVPTPLGTYNPDWAVLVEEDGKERLYFVVETKSPQAALLQEDALRGSEYAKILCGKAHFAALAVDKEKQNPAKYTICSTVADMLDNNARDATSEEIQPTLLARKPAIVTSGTPVFPERGREELAYAAFAGMMRDFPEQTIPVIRYASWFLTNPENCKVLLPTWKQDGFAQILNDSGLTSNFPATQKIRFWEIERRLETRGIILYSTSGRFSIPDNFDFRNAPDMTKIAPYLFEAVQCLEQQSVGQEIIISVQQSVLQQCDIKEQVA